MKKNEYIGDPYKVCFWFSILWPVCWDGANFAGEFWPIGKHALCDVNGNSLKLSDIKNGMYVKIRAKNVNYPGYEFLYTADGRYGKYFEICHIKT